MPRVDNGKDADKVGAQQAAQQDALIQQLQSTYSQAQLNQMIGSPGQEVYGYGSLSNYLLPYPNAPHDGGAEDQANTAAITKQLEGYNSVQAQIEGAPSGLERIGMGAALSLASAGLAAEVAPAAAAAAGGGFAGGVAGGAAAGAATGALNSVLTGGNVGKGILVGGLTGAAGGALSPVKSYLGQQLSAASGLSTSASSALVNEATQTATGAVRGAIDGQGAEAGAEASAENGAINNASRAVSGSIFNSGNTIFNSGSAAEPTTDTSLSQPTAPIASNSMGDDGDDNNDPTGNSGAPSSSDIDAQIAQELAQLGLISPGTADLGGVPNLAIDNGSIGGTNLSLSGGGSSGSNPLSALAGLLSGSTGLSSGTLASLLGTLASGGAAALNSGAAKDAANTYAGQTAFSPYSVSTTGGTTAFNGTNATSTLSPADQATSAGLNNLGQSSLSSLAAGPQAAAQNYYNQLQASQQDANNKYFQNNLDSQFANGVLGSTAGQYQSQAALANISQQQLQDQAAATSYANTQQQNQLANLTASLNGNNTLQTQQLNQLGTAGNLGTAAANANSVAYKPSLVANANSVFGGILSGLGNGATNSTPSILASLGNNNQTVPSDRALKVDIVPLAKHANGLTAYSYKYVWDTGTTHVGYMAQDVAKRFPDAVNDDNGYLAVDYRKVS